MGLHAQYANEENGLMTFDEIGRRLGISRERACQICRRAIRKLRDNARTAELLRASLSYDNSRTYRVERTTWRPSIRF